MSTFYNAGKTVCRRPIVAKDPKAKRVYSKPARRLIRLSLKKSFSTVEQKILKAIELRVEMRNLSSDNREAKRYLAKALSLRHAGQPL